MAAYRCPTCGNTAEEQKECCGQTMEAVETQTEESSETEGQATEGQ